MPDTKYQGFEDEAPLEKSFEAAPARRPWFLIACALIAGLVIGLIIGGFAFKGSSCDCSAVAGAPAPMEGAPAPLLSEEAHAAPAAASPAAACPVCPTCKEPAPAVVAPAPVEPSANETVDLVWGVTAGEITQTLLPRTMFTAQPNAFNLGSMSVESDFDAGNVGVVSAVPGEPMELVILPDPFSERDNKTFLGRFLYKVTTAAGMPLEMNIINAGDVCVASNEDAVRWATYGGYWQARASYDYKTWFLVDTTFDNSTGAMTITHTPTSDVVWYAYYPPYPMARLEEKLGMWAAQSNGLLRVETIGESVLGQGLYMVVLGLDCEEKAKIWVTAGQHPSEAQGPFFVEGLIDAALAAPEGDFFESGCLYTVPTINPDGMALGHHRTNAKGVNLNRVWDTPNLEESPEIYYLEEAMLKEGVDLYIDAHSDEDYPGHFIFFAEGVCAWNQSFAELRDTLDSSLKATNPEYSGLIPQGQDGAYEPEPHCEAALNYSDNWAADKFSTVGGTLEMPFQDVDGFTNSTTGFGPERAYEFGHQAFDAFTMTLPNLLEFRGMV